MSFAEVLAEIPRLSPEQRRELLRRVRDVETASASSANVSGFHLDRVDGRLVLTAPRIIDQAEVDTILAQFP